MYKRHNGENESDYIVRICGSKYENGWTWNDVADIINNELGYSFNESCYRKRYQSYKLSANQPKNFDCDDETDSLKKLKTQIEEERHKLYATKTELQRLTRQKNRFELFYDNIRHELTPFPTPVFNYSCNRVESDHEYVLTIADIHCGANFVLPCNSYSIDECEKRFDRLLTYISDYVRCHKINRIHVVELGDTIAGLLRVSDLQLNETSVVQATVSVAKMITNFLYRLSDHCMIDYYHVPSSNHSQNRPLGTKANELASEDIEYVIGNYIKDMLTNNKRIIVHTNFGSDYINIPIFDFNVIGMHGHTIKNYDTALKDLSVAHQKMIDYIIVGHLHHDKVIHGNELNHHDTEVLSCPSFQGTDPYAFNVLGKSSKAACKVFVFDNTYGCIETRKFILN